MTSDEDETARRAASADFSAALLNLHYAANGDGNAAPWALESAATAARLAAAMAVGLAFVANWPRVATVLLSSVLVTVLVVVEAHLHRRQAAFRARAELIENGLFAAVLWPNGAVEQRGWQDLLVAELRERMHPPPLGSMMAERLRRAYGWIYVVLLFTSLSIMAVRLLSLRSFVGMFTGAAFGPVPRWPLVLACLVIDGTGAVLALVHPWGQHRTE